jgi:hypothetical protein
MAELTLRSSRDGCPEGPRRGATVSPKRKKLGQGGIGSLGIDQAWTDDTTSVELSPGVERPDGAADVARPQGRQEEPWFAWPSRRSITGLPPQVGDAIA